MQEGPAGEWATHCTTQARAATNYGTWDEFQDSFKQAFISQDDAAVARNLLFQYKQEEKSITEYKNEFWALAQYAGITDFASLSQLYKNGLRPPILSMLMSLDMVPTSMEDTTIGAVTTKGLYAKSLDIKRILATIKDMYEQNRPKDRFTQFNDRRKQNIAAVNTDNCPRFTKLTPEERTRLLKEQQCFRCR